ncbi:hypothetical protein [uncultured Prevotella sp.]|uniref:hypothetical protein n=1 Tax=uncultured Prevotella sp. TaxID=159272 RepID=UPI0025D072E9|nr:hypothetical protein [uncultured Prevotella sp.]
MCNITKELIEKVWKKGRSITGYDDNVIRQDACGAWMRFDKYGDRTNVFGWEIDHIYPKSKLRERNVPDDEIDCIDNLRPLNWINNDSKGSDYPIYHARTKASGDKNIKCDNEYTVNENTQNRIERLFGKYLNL